MRPRPDRGRGTLAWSGSYAAPPAVRQAQSRSPRRSRRRSWSEARAARCRSSSPRRPRLRRCFSQAPCRAPPKARPANAGEHRHQISPSPQRRARLRPTNRRAGPPPARRRTGGWQRPAQPQAARDRNRGAASAAARGLRRTTLLRLTADALGRRVVAAGHFLGNDRSAAVCLRRIGGDGGQIDVVAVNRRLAIGEERLPHDALRIGDPTLLRLGVAAGGSTFLDNRTIGGLEATIDLGQLLLVFDLNAEMLDSLSGVIAGRNCEVDPRILEHPLRIVLLHHGRLRTEQGGVEADRLIEVLDSDMDMQALHADFLS